MHVNRALALSRTASTGGASLKTATPAKPKDDTEFVYTDSKGHEVKEEEKKGPLSVPRSHAVIRANPHSFVRKLASMDGGSGIARTVFGMKPVKARLVYDFGVTTSAANTALNTALPCDLAAAYNIASWINLFDEVRVRRVRLTAAVGLGGSGGTGGGLGSGLISCAWDPTDPTVVTSTQENFEATRHAMVVAESSTPSTLATGTVVSAIVASRPNGLLELDSGLLVPQIQGNSGGTVNPSPVGGDWIPTTSAAIVVGYFKYYIPAAGANTVSFHRSLLAFECEFRMRG